DTDMRHQFVLAMVWQPDYYSGDSAVLRHLTRGWSISPIVKMHSGFPFTINNGADANLDGVGTDRARLVGDPLNGSCPSGAPVGSITCWFNTAAFAKNNPTNGLPVDGTSPRNFLDAPSFRDVDLAISRSFKLTERFNLQFRGEALNVFNIVSLNSPS